MQVAKGTYSVAAGRAILSIDIAHIRAGLRAGLDVRVAYLTGFRLRYKDLAGRAHRP